MLKRVQIPDVLPSDLPSGSNFSLVAGDFEDIYGQQSAEADADEPSAGLWDAVLTCFFIDTVTICTCNGCPCICGLSLHIHRNLGERHAHSCPAHCAGFKWRYVTYVCSLLSFAANNLTVHTSAVAEVHRNLSGTWAVMRRGWVR